MKYIRPNSLTWWASVAPLVAGGFIALEPVHGASDWVAVVNVLTDHMSPAVLINVGLAGIGVRAAIK
jgi:hypothetical protein